MSPSATPVLLLHGLWMGRPAMWALQRRLRAAGFAPLTWGYRSIFGDLQRESDRLAGDWKALGSPVHVVGHSLGGHLALATAERHAGQLPAGRIVCLASPLAGSCVARQLRQHAWGRPLMGCAGLPLTSPVRVSAGHAVASIAGQRAFGAGSWLAELPAPHDGTVSVAETRIEGLSAHAIVPASHSGIVFNRKALAMVVSFLRDGRLEGDRDR